MNYEGYEFGLAKRQRYEQGPDVPVYLVKIPAGTVYYCSTWWGVRRVVRMDKKARRKWKSQG